MNESRVLMERLEGLFQEEYITAQARNIARYFVNISQDGVVCCGYKDIARSTDLSRRTVIRYIKELNKKGMIRIHRQTPYCNVYELIF